MSDRVITADLMARLQRHYIKPGDLMPGGMFLPEVALGSRRADALYVGFFQSRGRFLVGHEVKASRADWLHELDQPAKAETWLPHCHEWWIVAPSTDVVRPAELPEGWGLLIPGKSRTRMEVVVKATRYPDRAPSWEATHALVQKADSIRMQGITDAREKERESAQAEIEKRVEARLAYEDGSVDAQKRRADAAESKVEALEKALDIHLTGNPSTWNAKYVTVEQIEGSFRRWLAAERDVDVSLAQQIKALSSARDALRQLEGHLKSLRDEVAR